MHIIDTSAQHFLSNYYGEDDEAVPDQDAVEDQTAFEIFKTEDRAGKGNGGKGNSVWESLHAPLRTGVVDGKKVIFELKTNITQKPKTSRYERMHRKFEMIGSERSGWEYRIRFYLMHFSVGMLSLIFLAAFVALNVIFAGFFYAIQDRCCGDRSTSFGENFAFSIQTSMTIGYGGLIPSGTVSNFLVLWYVLADWGCRC